MKAITFLVAFTLAALTASGTASAACTAPACTKVINNGPDSGKKILVILGDGYASADQTKYNNDVNGFIVNGVFGNDYFREDNNAFNVYRLNLVSTDSGVSQVRYDEKGTPTNESDDTVLSRTTRNTALGYIYSGSWAHCWLEWGTNTEAAIQNAINTHVPNANYKVVLLNEDGYGGCGGGSFQQTTRAGDWTVMAHEFGHGVGDLWDEYTMGGAYAGSMTACPANCSTDTNRASTCWRRFIDPATAVPTSLLTGMDSNQSVGLFQGCGKKTTGIYRPVSSCRMNGNSPPYCPVCYTILKRKLYGNVGHNFQNAYRGDFNGDGKTDVLVHNGQDLAIYRSNGKSLSRVWNSNNIVPAASGGITWQPAAGDQYYVADFDFDGKSDVYVFNGSNWSMPYLAMLRSDGTGLKGVRRYDSAISGFWTMKPGDRYFVGDFDGDKRVDLAVANGTNWSMAYLGLLKSNGTYLSGTARYDGSFPGWSMRANDQYLFADFDKDMKKDLYVFNGKDWSYRYPTMAKSSGTGISSVVKYTGSLPNWSMAAGDEFHIADVNADGREDLYVFNGTNWAYPYLLMARSTGTGLEYVNRYDGVTSAIPGWQMQKGDRLFVSDFNGDSRTDLFVYNYSNWATQYLGALTSSGTALSGTWSADWVGGWNLGPTDKFITSRYDGGQGIRDLFVRNNEWFGLLRKTTSGFVMDRIYYHWIYTPLYDTKPWSDVLP